MQFHSTPVAEPPAQLCSLIVGLVAYGVSGMITQDHTVRLWVGMITSVLINLSIGAPVNVAMLDFLSLLIARPLSAAAGAGILALIANTFLS